MTTVSVIIPARNAEATLAGTLDSLLAQHMAQWEAVIVDDGSDDGTGSIAASYCSRDRRFHLVEAEGRGVSMARNAGLRHAKGEALLFLDADDWIAPDHLARMQAALEADRGAVASYCGYVRVTPGGQAFMPRFAPQIAVDASHVFTRGNPLTSHAIMLKRGSVEDLGGFDPGFRTCEDWDLWQRLARAGGRFIPVQDLHARYNLRSNSLSTDVGQLFRDASVLIKQGAEHDGADADDRASRLAWFGLWCGAVVVGQGQPFLDDLLPLPALRISPEDTRTAASTIMEALCTGACRTPAGFAHDWGETEQRLRVLLDAAVELPAHNPVLDRFAHMLGIDRKFPGEQVSVVIPAYKASQTIGETLQSVQTQSHAPLDIVVVDDGSADETSEKVLSLAANDPRISLMQQANAGVAAARNRGWKAAASDLIAFVDADDLWAPAKIERQLSALGAEGPEAGLAYTWYARIDDGSLITSRSHKPNARGDVLKAIFLGNFVGNGSAALMTRAALEHAGGFDPSLRERGAQGCEDFSIYFRIAEAYRFALVPEPLTGYRVLLGNMSSDMLRMLRSFDLVVAEMLDRHPEHRRAILAGRAYFLEWSLLTAVERGDFEQGLRLYHAYFRQSPGSAAGVLFLKIPRALVRGLRFRIMGKPRRRRDYAPVRFPIGSYEESHG